MKIKTFYIAVILVNIAMTVNSQPFRSTLIKNAILNPTNIPDKSTSYFTRSTNLVHTKSIDYVWNGYSWDYSGNARYSYNADGMPTHTLLVDTTKSLKLFQAFYNYDNYNNSTGTIYELWNKTTTKWDTLDISYPAFSTRYLYQYDASNHITQSIYQNWSNGWQNVSKEDYILNVNGKYIKNTVYDWSFNNWIPNHKDSLCTWNGDQLASYIRKTFYVGGEWKDYEKYTSVFTGKNFVGLFEKINGSGTGWDSLERYTKIFDPNGGYIIITEQYNDSTWGNAFRDLYYIDSLGNYCGYRSDEWYAGNWRQDVGTFITHTYNANEIMLSETLSVYSTTTDTLELQEKHIFSEFKIPPVTSIKELTSSSIIKIYPNPASDCIFIEDKGNDNSNTTINLYDINGRLILNRVFNKNENTVKIDLNGYKAGIYLIEVGNEKGVSHSRLLIK